MFVLHRNCQEFADNNATGWKLRQFRRAFRCLSQRALARISAPLAAMYRDNSPKVVTVGTQGGGNQGQAWNVPRKLSRISSSTRAVMPARKLVRSAHLSHVTQQCHTLTKQIWASQRGGGRSNQGPNCNIERDATAFVKTENSLETLLCGGILRQTLLLRQN